VISAFGEWRALVTADRFWEIVAASRTCVDPEDYVSARRQQAVRFRELLLALTDGELRGFASRFGERLDEAYSPPGQGLWAVAFDIGGGCSDDSFDDFRGWLISMGREVFEAAVRDPETVHEVAERAGLEDDVFFEDYEFILSRVLGERAGRAEPHS
jgi:hypothetical protein